jgi:hypothetical protein
VTDLSTSEQRARAGLSSTGTHLTRRGRPKDATEIKVGDEKIRLVSDQGNGLDERPDKAWEDMNTEQAREQFELDKRERHQSRKASRRTMPLWMRLEQVTNAVGRLQAPKARALSSAPGRGGSDGERVLPPGGSDAELAYLHPAEFDRRMRTIEMAVERLEELLDAHRGLAPARDFALMISDEKNKIILTDFEGWRPEEVHAFEPALGKPRTIRWVREQVGRRGVCGHLPDACDCEGVRKAPTRSAA